MGNWIASLFSTALGAVAQSRSEGRNSVASVIRTIIRAPLKAIGAFIFAPFLVFCVASLATDKRRKWVAAIGLFAAVLLSLGAGTLLGTLAGAFLVNSLFGPWIAIGFLVGTTFSVVLTLTFQVLVLNATCFLFLGLSSEEVVGYLQKASE
jgi:hypothetical protein